ncbi:hypothetical protein M011DRAFT_459020 [Sporormia fimetaria CBS 119925]|uniref:F-box domain-containing protein n=1 Tax=Sporormia fimetaria CBS 119925 TaxID=1340428 RepID=A0A6A6V7W0_9PLEO|nr:hypothetical protein M011DRAFT_459020 [Sporormia fimetaria CBS 119925]
MPNLQTLPNELLLAICYHLPTGALHALSLTCRTLTPISQPLLYTSIHFSNSHAHIHSLFLFMRTILLYPDLASLVKSLSLAPLGTRWSPEFTHHYARELRVVRQLAKAADIEVHFTKCTGPPHLLATFHAFLFFLLPGLKHLRINRTSERTPDFRGEPVKYTPLHAWFGRSVYIADEEAADILSRFGILQNVESLYLRSYDAQLLDLRFPCLTHLTLTLDLWRESGVLYKIPRYPGLKRLDTRCEARELDPRTPELPHPVLPLLLERLGCKGLEYFGFTLLGEELAEGGEEEWYAYEHLVDNISVLASCIETLKLGFELPALITWSRRDFERFHPVREGCLERFGKVKRLVAPGFALWSARYGEVGYEKPDMGHFLPRGVEVLVVRVPWDGIVEWFRGLCEVLGSYRSLRRVEVECRWNAGWVVEDAKRELRDVGERFRARGVEFDVYAGVDQP